MTLIEISEKIRDHLIKQNQPALHENGTTCMYRGVGDTKCAVGCLIKDEFYHTRMEHAPMRNPDVKEALKKSLGYPMTTELEEVLASWQFYHDTYFGLFLVDQSEISPQQQFEKVQTYIASVINA